MEDLISTCPIRSSKDAAISRIKLWRFDDSHIRTLFDDIPYLMQFYNCVLWAYYKNGSTMIGFSTMQISREYQSYNDMNDHFYIPLLAVNPDFVGNGHGNFIVNHLIEASQGIDQKRAIFLDVYHYNTKAIRLYEKHGFQRVMTATPLFDDRHSNNEYYVMKREPS